ncbi:MAG: glycosyltransferase family 4 protein [Akkermansiaceae bacterium]|nr:glycosyltransferase family 4 protein [Akkermansiaceae bacterium]
MKILFITSHAPCGPDHGARLRARKLMVQLRRFGDVHLVLAGAYEAYGHQENATAEDFLPIRVFEFWPWPIRSMLGRIKFEVGSDDLNTHRVSASAEDQVELKSLINAYDLVWVHGLRVANGFNLWRWPKTILDIDDIPSEVAWNEIANSDGFVRRFRAFRQYMIWRRHERRLCERFDGLAVCSAADRARFSGEGNVYVVSNGCDVPSVVPVRRQFLPLRIGFVGSLEYGPNASGMRWFLRYVWPRLVASFPELTLRIVGKYSDSPEWVNCRNVDGLGWIPELDDEIATWALTIVPIFEGGGTRIKVSTAFSRKCPVVSTQLGVYGYDVTNGNEVLIADSVVDFEGACQRVLEDHAFGDQLAGLAWDRFKCNWTWAANSSCLAEMVEVISGMPDDLEGR